jgi:transcriptional regulator with XRE-family HTH domain
MRVDAMDQVVSPEQLRAARALLGWSRARLAALAGISPSTLARAETGKPSSPSTRAAIRCDLVEVKLEFAPDDARGVKRQTETIIRVSVQNVRYTR